MAILEINGSYTFSFLGNNYVYNATPTKSSSALTKGYIKNLDTGETKHFQYNPTPPFEYSRGATYNTIDSPSQNYPNIQFVKGNVRKFSVDIFLTDKPYTGYIDKDFMPFIGALLTPETNVPNQKRPPKFIFNMGYFTRTCVLEDLNISIEEFNPKLKPTRATMTLQMIQVSV